MGKRITRKRIKKKSPPIDPRDLVESGHADPCDMCYDAPYRSLSKTFR